MRNQIEHLTPRRRVTFAWGLILLALLCQFTPVPSPLNLFALFFAATFHETLVPRVRSNWEKPLVRIVCWVFLPGLLLVFYFTRFPAERAVYVFYAVAIPFLVLEAVNDIRYVKTAEKGSDSAVTARE